MLAGLFAEKIAVGSYVGTSFAGWPKTDGQTTTTDWKNINVGFKPKAVILLPYDVELFRSGSNSYYLSGGIFSAEIPLRTRFFISVGFGAVELEFAHVTENGFEVRNIKNMRNSNTYIGDGENSNRGYLWAAFR